MVHQAIFILVEEFLWLNTNENKRVMKTNTCPATWENDLHSLAQAKFYLLCRRGPLLFKIRSGDNDLTYTVCIATPSHRCSCGGGEAKGHLCIHILFVIIKVLKVPHSNPLAWQFEWREGEVNRALSGIRLGNAGKNKSNAVHAFLRKGDGAKARPKEDDPNKDNLNQPAVDEAVVAQRELDTNSTCSICQDEMTETELLIFCSTSCGSSFHKACMRIYIGHNRMERKAVSCPLCRAPWTASLAASAKSNNDGKASTRVRLPSLQCKHCRLTIHKRQFVRCASCPSLDLCQSCFNGGAASSHDPSHLWFLGEDASHYPTNWRAVGPSAYRGNRLREERERLSMLQYRDLSSADYHELLSLDSQTPPLHEHLVNALPDVSIGGQGTDCGAGDDARYKCSFCHISLRVDRSAKQLPCPSQHLVHRTCAVNILLSALSASECAGTAVGGIVCPFCPASSDSKSTCLLLFPSLQREPVRDRPVKPTNNSKSKPLPMPPCDVANLSNALDRSATATGGIVAIKPCLSISGMTPNSTAATKPAKSHAKSEKHAAVVDHWTRRSQIRHPGIELTVNPLDCLGMSMALSGTNPAARRKQQQPKQTKKSINMQLGRSGKLAPRKCISNNTDRSEVYEIEYRPSNLNNILQIGKNKAVKK